MSDSHRYISCAIRSDALTAPVLGLRSGTQLARVCTARLTAPESVGRRCVQLRESGADFALGPRMVHGALAFWMQTTGATLLTVRQCSLACMWMLAQGSRSAYGLLYFTAVRGDMRERGQ